MDNLNEKKEKVSIVGENTEGLPMWSITNYFDELCCNYYKLLMVEQLAYMLNQGNQPINFAIGKMSLPLRPTKRTTNTYLYNYKNTFISLIKNQEVNDEFWNVFKKYSRPMIYYLGTKNRAELSPLYDYTNDEAFKITDISYHCPIESTISAVGSVLISLVEAGRDDKRKIEEHSKIMEILEIVKENAYMDQNIKLMQTDIFLNNPNVSEGIKAYIRENRDYIIDKQSRENVYLGVRRIDCSI